MSEKRPGPEYREPSPFEKKPQEKRDDLAGKLGKLAVKGSQKK